MGSRIDVDADLKDIAVRKTQRADLEFTPVLLGPQFDQIPLLGRRNRLDLIDSEAAPVLGQVEVECPVLPVGYANEVEPPLLHGSIRKLLVVQEIQTITLIKGPKLEHPGPHLLLLFAPQRRGEQNIGKYEEHGGEDDKQSREEGCEPEVKRP